MSASTYHSMAAGWRLPNVWDAVAFLCVIGALVGVGHVAEGTMIRIDAPGATEITLDPTHLPEYAIRTTMRMFAALAASLLFTFTYGTAAAKSRRAALVLVPVLDVLQSVPILGFLTFTVVFFMGLFPGQVIGLELAAIFAIFTSQAWNMTFSMYQSMRNVPKDLEEASQSFHLSGWQRFWRLDVPFAMPGLIWNTMMSMSGGWFFVVASEAISVGDNTWKLPGIGSYVAAALEARDIRAVAWAILAMLVVILLYDQLLFRPLVAWSAKFRFETTAGATASAGLREGETHAPGEREAGQNRQMFIRSHVRLLFVLAVGPTPPSDRGSERANGAARYAQHSEIRSRPRAYRAFHSVTCRTMDFHQTSYIRLTISIGWPFCARCGFIGTTMAAQKAIRCRISGHELAVEIVPHSLEIA